MKPTIIEEKSSASTKPSDNRPPSPPTLFFSEMKISSVTTPVLCKRKIDDPLARCQGIGMMKQQVKGFIVDKLNPPPGDPKNCIIIEVNQKDATKYYGIGYIDHYKKNTSQNIITLNGDYAFVRMQNSELRAFKQEREGDHRHAFISGSAEEVLYAGTISFKDGALTEWTNRSGVYQPNIENNKNADLPLKLFSRFEELNMQSSTLTS